MQELDAILGITPNLVSARLLRAKKLMKQKLLTEREEFQDGTSTV